MTTSADPPSGLFVAVDGIDGAGKTTLVNGLAAVFRSRRTVVTTREPTDESDWGRRLRRSAIEGRLPADVELDYFHRDRLHHLEHVIEPALRVGSLVITDRYVDSTLAYQAADPVAAVALHRRLSAEIRSPDLTLILVCPVTVGLRRIATNRTAATTFETTTSLDRAAAIYESRDGPGYARLDASASPDAVLRAAMAVMVQRFPDLAERPR